MSSNQMHAVLLGDSIFDNTAYVSEGSSVIEQLRARLPENWRVTLLARDGAVTTDLDRQLERLPEGVTHLIVSAGGNDALESTPLVNSPLTNSQDMLDELVSVQATFRQNYQKMIDLIRRVNLPVVACTIYDSVPDLRPVERMALSLFNDVIVQEVFLRGFPLLDLRILCGDVEDYSKISPIEPSEVGGGKIAREIQYILVSHDFHHPRTIVY